ADPRTRQACLWLGMTLGETGRPFVREVVRSLPRAGEAGYPSLGAAVTLRQAAGLLTREGAATAAARLTEQAGPSPLPSLAAAAAAAFGAVAPRLDRAEVRRLAGAAAGQLVGQLRNTTDATLHRSRAAALAAAAAHLDAGQAAALAARAVEQM